MALDKDIARYVAHHSGLFSEMIATLSPFLIPFSIR
jgi:hypothetical protein